MERPKLFKTTVNGKPVQYGPDSIIQVDVGHGAKGRYEPRATYVGLLTTAVSYYRAINIGNGYKKRLVVDGKVVVRQFSHY